MSGSFDPDAETRGNTKEQASAETPVVSSSQHSKSFRERKLGRRVLAAILLCSTLLAFMATGVQLFSDFTHDVSQIKQRMTDIEQSYLESIAVSTWNFDHVQLKTQMQGILRLPDICSVKLTDVNNALLEQAGKCSQDFEMIERIFPVVFIRDASKKDHVPLGTLTVMASYEDVFLRMQNKVLIILTTQGIKTFIVAIFILYIFHRLVGHPLQLLAQAARRLNVNRLAEPIVLRRKKPTRGDDELDVLVTAMNNMRVSLLDDVAELHRTKEALQSSEEHYRSLVESTNVVPWESDARMQNFSFIGPQAQRMLGVPTERWYQPGFWFSVLHLEDHEKFLKELNYAHTDRFDIECRFLKPDGREYWLLAHVERLRLPNGGTGMRGFLIDIDARKRIELELDHYRAELEQLVASRTTELKQNVSELQTTVERLHVEMREREIAERTLRENEERYRMLIEMSPDAVMVEQDGEITFVNNGAMRLLGATSAGQIVGKSMSDLVPEDYTVLVAERMQKLLDGHQNLGAVEEKIKRLDGSLLDVEVSRGLFHYRGRNAIQAVVHDITPHKHFAEQLRKQALYDALTGLPNRALLMDRLTDALTLAQRQQQQLLVVFIDLDHFKVVNDSLGHEAGDRLLVTVSRRISACIRKSDTLARLGGDEFIMLVRNTTDNEAVLKMIDRIIAEVSHPIVLDGREVSITCSIGYSVYPKDGEDSATLIKRADAAMYQAKEQGRNRIQHYTADLQVRVDERLLMESQLRRALERQEFAVRYQPVVNLNTGRIAGFEALVRWQHPEFGLLLPSRFIRVAEETGLISQIGEWVMRTACAQLLAWHRAGLPQVYVSVNLSLHQFLQPNFESTILNVLAESGLPAKYLQFEVTESLSMKDPENTIRILTRFKELGIGINIDDFGTGYSNLAYLKRFPADWIKLDRSFVYDLTQSGDKTIVEAIIDMAHKLGLKIIAEGVETEEQLHLLASYGCDAIQGFYFSKPATAEACAEMLQKKRVLELPFKKVAR